MERKYTLLLSFAPMRCNFRKLFFFFTLGIRAVLRAVPPPFLHLSASWTCSIVSYWPQGLSAAWWGLALGPGMSMAASGLSAFLVNKPLLCVTATGTTGLFFNTSSRFLQGKWERGKTRLCGYHDEEVQEATLHPMRLGAGRCSFNKQIFIEGLICLRNCSWIKVKIAAPTVPVVAHLPPWGQVQICTTPGRWKWIFWLTEFRKDSHTFLGAPNGGTSRPEKKSGRKGKIKKYIHTLLFFSLFLILTSL